MRSVIVAACVLAAGVGIFSAFHYGGASAQPCRRPGMWGGPTGAIGAGGESGVAPSIRIRLERSGGTLDAVKVDVSAERRTAHGDVEVDVLHRASLCTTRYSSVYRSRFSATNPPSAWVGPTTGIAEILRGGPFVHHLTYPLPALSPWTGTIRPRDWTGGCRRGRYWIYVTWPVAGYGMDGWGGHEFTCR